MLVIEAKYQTPTRDQAKGQTPASVQAKGQEALEFNYCAIFYIHFADVSKMNRHYLSANHIHNETREMIAFDCKICSIVFQDINELRLYMTHKSHILL